MGVVAALGAIMVAGISILQRSQRDSARKNALGEIVNILSEYNVSNLGYPSESIVEFRTDGFSIEGELKLELNGAKTPAEQTDTSSTKYYYRKTIQGYALCAELESGAIESVGSSSCPDVSIW